MSIPLMEDYIKTLEAWPVAGTMELDYELFLRLHRIVIDPFLPDPMRLRALRRLGQIMDRPLRKTWQDVQEYMRSQCTG